MDLGLRDRTALVCASTGGLGRAVAEALGREGARVVVCGRRGELAREVASGLDHAIGVTADLNDADAADHLVETAEETFGPVEILVLNGPGPRPARAAAVSADDVAEAVRSLLITPQRLVGRVLPGMRERGWGRILAIGSSGVVAPIPDLALSNTGRAALAGYLKTLASEVAADGVTVNLLLPGRIATPRLAALDTARAEREGRTAEEVAAASASTIPAGRYGDPAEFGAFAAFLCSAQAAYVTGTATRCDGGLVPTL